MKAGGGTVLVEQGAAELLLGTRQGVSLEAGALVLASGAERGSVLGPEIVLPASFDRVCLSLNGETGGDSTIELALEVVLEDGSRTEWLPVLVAGAASEAARTPRSFGTLDRGLARVAVDVVELSRAPGRALRFRLSLARSSSGETPRARRVAATAWEHGNRDREPAGARHAAWGRVLPVPERSQLVEDGAIAARICSPTSLSMVLSFWGRERRTGEVAREVLDREAGIYGNWSLNVFYASRLDLEATIVRMGSFAPLEDEIAAGRPVVISHRWCRGELEGAPLPESRGHLVVVRGFTTEGDLVVNDPCADLARGESVRRVYRRADIEKTWLANADGIAYLLRGT